MPIREYRCGRCGIVIERHETIKELKEPMQCDICDIKMERIISKSSFILKGGCWAKDGYTKTNK